MGKCITIVSSKGGVGKTTLAANLGGLLADTGSRVLLVDADIQPTLSSFYPLEVTAKYGLTQIIHTGSTEDAISRTVFDRLDLIYSDDPEWKLSDFILHTPDGNGRLKFAMGEIQHDYDYIIIDTQGARTPLQRAAVLAGDLLVSPISPDIVSAREFRRGTQDLVKNLEPMYRMGLPVGPLVALLYRVERTVDAAEIAAALRRASNAGEFTLLDTVVPHTAVYKRAATKRLPVHRVERTRRGPNPSAKKVMQALTDEILGFSRTTTPNTGDPN